MRRPTNDDEFGPLKQHGEVAVMHRVSEHDAPEDDDESDDDKHGSLGKAQDSVRRATDRSIGPGAICTRPAEPGDSIHAPMRVSRSGSSWWIRLSMAFITRSITVSAHFRL